MYKTLILLLLCSFIFTQEQSWASTRFEKFWYKKFKKLTFRKPFTLFPYNIKVGYYQYGSDKYWSQFTDILKGQETLKENPITFTNNSDLDLDDINNSNNRKMFAAEIDIFKYNFFYDKQNIIDIQFGLGYKIIKSLNNIYSQSNGVDIHFKPFIKSYNINTSFYFQWETQRYYQLYYSIGYADADLYKSESGDATGNGINQSIGLGLYFIRSRNELNSDSHHGIEIRFDKITIDDIKDPLDNIEKFKIKQIGILYSFGIGYGGKKTLGDEAYLDMINGDYISAVEKFYNFERHNTIFDRNDEIKEMISFSKGQMPYQMYNNAENDFKSGYLEQALWWLNKSFPIAPEELKEKIQYKKILIISELLKTELDSESINEQINILKGIKQYDHLNEDLNKKISDLLIKKAKIFMSQNNYFDAASLFVEAQRLYPENKAMVNLKLEEMTVRILNDVYNFLQNNEHFIAYEHLLLISKYSNKKSVTEALSRITNDNIEDKKITELRFRIQNILYGSKKKAIGNSDIYLGDSFSQVVEILGFPTEAVKRKKLGNLYELYLFNIFDFKYNLYFRNKILIDIEGAK